MDRISTDLRSKNMAAVKSRGNLTTEIALVELFRREGITGWRRNKKIVGIRPDFIFPKKKAALFVHGCFWHGCSKHGQIPKTSKAFWGRKIKTNQERDKRQKKLLSRAGWNTWVIWEHEFKKPSILLKKAKNKVI